MQKFHYYSEILFRQIQILSIPYMNIEESAFPVSL